MLDLQYADEFVQVGRQAFVFVNFESFGCHVFCLFFLFLPH